MPYLMPVYGFDVLVGLAAGALFLLPILRWQRQIDNQHNQRRDP